VNACVNQALVRANKRVREMRTGMRRIWVPRNDGGVTWGGQNQRNMAVDTWSSGELLQGPRGASGSRVNKEEGNKGASTLALSGCGGSRGWRLWARGSRARRGRRPWQGVPPVGKKKGKGREGASRAESSWAVCRPGVSPVRLPNFF
jgi:hypothetical protein